MALVSPDFASFISCLILSFGFIKDMLVFLFSVVWLVVSFEASIFTSPLSELKFMLLSEFRLLPFMVMSWFEFIFKFAPELKFEAWFVVFMVFVLFSVAS